MADVTLEAEVKLKADESGVAAIGKGIAESTGKNLESRLKPFAEMMSKIGLGQPGGAAPGGATMAAAGGGGGIGAAFSKALVPVLASLAVLTVIATILSTGIAPFIKIISVFTKLIGVILLVALMPLFLALLPFMTAGIKLIGSILKDIKNKGVMGTAGEVLGGMGAAFSNVFLGPVVKLLAGLQNAIIQGLELVILVIGGGLAVMIRELTRGTIDLTPAVVAVISKMEDLRVGQMSLVSVMTGIPLEDLVGDVEAWGFALSGIMTWLGITQSAIDDFILHQELLSDYIAVFDSEMEGVRLTLQDKIFGAITLMVSGPEAAILSLSTAFIDNATEAGKSAEKIQELTDALSKLTEVKEVEEGVKGKSLIDQIVEGLTNIWDAVSLGARAAVSGMPGAGGGGGGGLVSGLGTFLAEGASAVFGGVAYEGTAGGTPVKVQEGGFVTRGGVAEIHKGETIIPAKKGGAGDLNLTVHVHGNIYGVEDLEKTMNTIMKRGLNRRSGYAIGQ